MDEMKRCPFCGAVVDEEFPYFYYHKGMGLWVFDHSCTHGDLKCVTTLWGKTREEVVERWNTRAEV